MESGVCFYYLASGVQNEYCASAISRGQSFLISMSIVVVVVVVVYVYLATLLTALVFQRQESHYLVICV